MAQQQTGVTEKSNIAPNDTLDHLEFNALNDTVNSNATDAESRLLGTEIVNTDLDSRLTLIEATSIPIQTYDSETLPETPDDGTLAFLNPNKVLIYSKNSLWYKASDNSLVATGGVFVMQIDTSISSTSDSNQFNLGLATVAQGFTPITIDWGDGVQQPVTSYNHPHLLHTYPSSGTFTISIQGAFTLDYENGSSGAKDAEKILNISDWGQFFLGSESNYGFAWASNLEILATGSPTIQPSAVLTALHWHNSSLTVTPEYTDTANILNLDYFLYTCTSLVELAPIDTSGCLSFFRFARESTALTTIPLLDLSSGEDFRDMFRNCSLDSESIDNFMQSLVNSGQTNEGTSCGGGTSLAFVNWSVEALANHDELVLNRGWTIATN